MWSILQKEHVETRVNVDLILKNSKFQNFKISKFKDLVTETKMNFTMSGKKLKDAETHVLTLKF